MKSPDRQTISTLESLPNVGKAIAANLRLINICHPRDLIGKDPVKLHQQLCQITGKKIDPCVLDTFMSIVYFMEGGEARPWWSFTDERKSEAKKRAGI
ncbi:MAG: helix-hairpin-helix domain-containing protein [Gammaproteobacteria bacterium]|nr:helix-hairpin-helix domain-containing protein [Gammaproteobacteria bacterium]